MSQPTVAIIGRPNVGKSTLFNRICRQRRSLVGNEPGMTRDRVIARAEWGGRQFEIIDTGGMVPGDRDPMPGFIFEQAETAIRKAQVLVLVVDGRIGLTPLDQSLGKLLIECSKPVVVAVNKCDSVAQSIHASEFSELGLREVIPLSAAHGLNVGDLLDEVVKHLPRGSRSKRLPPGEIRVAIVGKPNVGKSTLLNRILGEDRTIVSPIPGTTRDAIDSRATRDGKVYRFMDTAGIRKKRQTFLQAEKLSVMMARKSVQRADVALVMMDATEAPSSLDSAIAGYVQEVGASAILVVNKWDLKRKDSGTMVAFEKQVRSRVRFLAYAPMLFISAATGQRVPKLISLIDQVFKARRTRIGTGALNAFLQREALRETAVPFSRQVKVQYMTQVHDSPPTFVLFTARKSPLHPSIHRYLVNRIRERFGFVGTPVVLKHKVERKAG